MNIGFLFVDAPSSFRRDQSWIARLPRRISSKQQLFAVLADKLRFPSYFGRNWDALEECLGDLSWLPADRAVFLVHLDLPFRSGGQYRTVYLDLLQSVAAQATDASRRLTFVFPSELRTVIFLTQ
jgi:RNAse (barnase) inhibitor barstar